MRGAGAGQRGSPLLATSRSAHLSWLPRSLSLCPAHNDCTLPSLPAASAPRPPDALLCIFSPKFASARVWASASRAAPTHNICVLFHPNLYPEIVLSCTRAGVAVSPHVSDVSGITRLSRQRGEAPHSAPGCTGCSLVCSLLICSVHHGDIFINSESPAGFVSLAPQFNKLGFYCV